MNTVFLRLEGPLQSWGERSRWSIRDSAAEPTKSGVIGLIACALGWGADQSAEIKSLSKSVRMGVRCDQPGTMLRDYHTVHGGARSAEGKIKRTASTGVIETVVSERYYLCDARFLVALLGGEETIQRINSALENPHWPIFLGRKSCPPASPVPAGLGDFVDLEAALISGPGAEELSGQQIRILLECKAGKGNSRRDEMENLKARVYGPRYVEEKVIALEGGQK
jgi:CRISPR system Cascade subunit CasD